MGIEEALGKDFLEKYQQALRNSRVKRLAMTPEVKSEIIQLIKSEMKPESASLNYPKNGLMYHIILAETPEELQVRELKWGKAVMFNWIGKWISCTMPDEMINQLMPSTPYFLIGYMKTKQGNDGRMFFNMTVHAMLTTDNVAKYNSDTQTSQKDINKNLEEHK